MENIMVETKQRNNTAPHNQTTVAKSQFREWQNGEDRNFLNMPQAQGDTLIGYIIHQDGRLLPVTRQSGTNAAWGANENSEINSISPFPPPKAFLTSQREASAYYTGDAASSLWGRHAYSSPDCSRQLNAPCALVEDKDSFQLFVEAPGVDLSCSTVRLLGNQVYIECEKRLNSIAAFQQSAKNKNILYSDMTTGKYVRVINLPILNSDCVDMSKTENKYCDGVLEVCFKKTKKYCESSINLAE